MQWKKRRGTIEEVERDKSFTVKDVSMKIRKETLCSELQNLNFFVIYFFTIYYFIKVNV